MTSYGDTNRAQNVDFSLVVFCDIHSGEISQRVTNLYNEFENYSFE